MDVITITTKTVDEATMKALIKLETTSDKLEYEVAGKRSTGFPDISTESAAIRAKKKGSIEDETMDFLSQMFEAINMQINIMVVYNREGQELSLNLEDEDTGTLIGERGQALDSLRYLVSLIVNEGTEGYLRVKLDTENCRERRREALKTLARNAAYKVRRIKGPISLEPMSPYERRIVHATPQNDKYATTRGKRGEPFRHMVVVLRKETAPDGHKGRYDRNKRRRYERSNCSGGCRSNCRTSGNSASQINSDVSTEAAADGEEQTHPWLVGCRQ